mgnify:CR=1 FL=1
MAADSPHLAFAPDFRVADWLVEPSLDRLSRGETVLHLRPQLTNLLVLLAEHAGKTVSKDEILARVWEGQFVAESGMTRCVAELRQALGDDAREPTVLETIPKRGYRLVAPVVFLDEAPRPAAPELAAGASPAVAPPSPVPDAVTEERPTAQGSRLTDGGDDSQLTDGRDGSRLTAQGPQGPGPRAVVEAPEEAAAAADVEAGDQPSRRVPWHAFRTPLIAAVLLGLAWGVFGWSRAPALGERDTVLLADVANATGDPAFDRTLGLALAVQLGQAPFLRFLPAESSRVQLALMGRRHDEAIVGALALEVCRREGAAALIAGSVAKLGTHYAVGLEAIACRDGDSLGRQLLEVEKKDDVLDALGTAAGRLRRTLGESRASLRQHDVPIVRATTPSLDALKALSLGDFNRDHARLPEALTFYRRATELDPQFAVAWARRGVTARNLGLFAPDERFGGTSEPMYCFRRAYELGSRVSEPERLYIQAHYFRFVEGDPDKTAETYQIWRRTYPGALTPTLNLASLNNAFGRYDEALSLAREAVRNEPYSSLATSALVVALLGTNHVPEAKQALQDARNHGVDDSLWHELAVLIAEGEGDEAAIEEHAQRVSQTPQGAASVATVRALAAADTGRLRQSRALWAEAGAAVRQANGPRSIAGVKLIQAETEMLIGDPRVGRAAVAAALEIDHDPGTRLAAAIVLALGGDRARARSLLEEIGPLSETTIPAKCVWGPAARALIEASPGHYEEALGIMNEIVRYERSRDFNLGPLGLRASLELSAGHPDRAAARFQDLLALRPVAPSSPWVSLARVGLARALRDWGKVDESRAAYDAALAWMKDADADAPLLLAARRERAAL